MDPIDRLPNKLPTALIYGLDAPEPEDAQALNAEPLCVGPEPKPWDKQAGEDCAWYEKFLYYLHLGPERSMRQAARELLTKQSQLLPGEPVPAAVLFLWHRTSVEWSWVLRARYWDRENLRELQTLIEEERRQHIKDVAKEHIAGWEAFQTAAIRAIYQKDDEGHFLLDEFGRPQLKEIDDVGTASRVFKMATQGKRVELGLPNDLIAMSVPQLVTRYRELMAANDPDEDIIEGEVTERA